MLLMWFNEFPMPADMGALLAGWFLYSMFTLSLCLILAPLSEMSDVLERVVPVTTYMMIPFSGTFNMTSWLTPEAQDAMYYSPFVHGMEMMRHGIFGDKVDAIYDPLVPIGATLVCMLIGLAMCRRVRRDLVVE
jgi:capsular polysaccharide transport system permease protein